MRLSFRKSAAMGIATMAMCFALSSTAYTDFSETQSNNSTECSMTCQGQLYELGKFAKAIVESDRKKSIKDKTAEGSSNTVDDPFLDNVYYYTGPYDPEIVIETTIS